MPYSESSVYNKFQGGCQNPSHHPHSCGCQHKSEDCGCCPPGLVAVYDDEGNQVACLTPNDAELYQKNTYTCKDGYVKLIRVSDGVFMGCVSESEFANLYTTVNP